MTPISTVFKSVCRLLVNVWVQESTLRGIDDYDSRGLIILSYRFDVSSIVRERPLLRKNPLSNLVLLFLFRSAVAIFCEEERVWINCEEFEMKDASGFK